MKKCPFCAEEIQDAAIKCKHCGEFLDGAERPSARGKNAQWYLGTPFIIFMLFCVGPFALPLIWMRPQTTRAWKLGLTAIILLLSWLLFQATLKSIGVFIEYYELLNEL